MTEQNNRVLEIDIIEWMKEIKKHLLLIIAVTLLFAASTGAYLYKTAGSSFSYSLFVHCTALSEKDSLTFVRLFQNDVGVVKQQNNKTASLSKVEMVNTGSESKDIKDRYTAMMKFEFTGNNAEYVKSYGTEYVNAAVKTLNIRLDKYLEVVAQRDYLNTIKNELTRINDTLINGSMYNDGTLPAKSLPSMLARLKEKLEVKELSKTIEKAYVLTPQNNNARRVGLDKTLILKSAALGFVLSIVFVSCKYLAKAIR